MVMPQRCLSREEILEAVYGIAADVTTSRVDTLGYRVRKHVPRAEGPGAARRAHRDGVGWNAESVPAGFYAARLVSTTGVIVRPVLVVR